MRHSISRQVPGQHGASRLPLPPRAASGVTAHNASSQPPAQPLTPSTPHTTGQHPVVHTHGVPVTSTTPNVATAAGDIHPTGAEHPAHGYPAALPHIATPPVNGNAYAGLAPSDLSQRLMMEQMAILQRQLLDMAALVANTQAQNTELVAQVHALTLQVQGMAAPGGQQAAQIPLQAQQHQPQQAVVDAGAVAERQSSVVASLGAPQSGPVSDSGEADVQPLPASTARGPEPAAAAAATSDKDAAVAGVAGLQPSAVDVRPMAEPLAAVTKTAAGADTSNGVGAQVQQLSEAAAQLQGLFLSLAARTAAEASATESAAGPLTNASGAMVANEGAGGSGGAGGPQKQDAQERLPRQQRSNDMAAAAAPDAQSAARQAGRGGRYVGPPREQPVFARAPQDAGGGAGAGGAAASPSGRREQAGGSSHLSGTTAPGSSSRNSKGDDSMNSGADKYVRLGASGQPTAAATGMEARVRGCGSVAALRSVVDEDRLSPQQAVLAAQQLPRLARLAHERQQEQQLQQQQEQQLGRQQRDAAGKGAAGGGGDAEAAALRELHLRLLARFSSQNAIAGLRPAFLPSYLALAAVCVELRQPPSRAFAGAVRHLVTQHVADLAPEVAAAAVAAVAGLDGTVAPGVLERACRVVMDAAAGGGDADAAIPSPRLLGWRALVAAGQLAPLGGTAKEAARQVLSAAAMSSEAAAVALDADELAACAQGVMACSGAGVAVPPALMRPLETASCREEVLSSVGPAGQLALAKALVAAGHQPQEAWVDAWEAAVVASMPRASPGQVAALAAALHTLTRGAGRSVPSRARPVFTAAVAERLLAAGGGSAAGSGASACALTLHLGELAGGGGQAAPLAAAKQLAESLLSIAVTALSSLDVPDLAALVSGLSLLDVRTPAEVWSAMLSRATDAPAAAAAVTAAARRALELGLPAGIKPASLEHFLSVAGQHVGELPAGSLVGLLGLAAAVKSKLRPALLASVLTRLHDYAATMGPQDGAFLFAAVDSLSLPLTQPMAPKPLAATGKDDGGAAFAVLTPAGVLRRVSEAALVPEQVLAVLGPERTAQLVQLVARLQQAASTASAAAAVGDAGAAELDVPVGAEVSGGGSDDVDVGSLVPRRQLVALLHLLQPSLQGASPQALAALASGASALGLAVPPAWLAALVEAALETLPALDPLTSARIAAAVTRLERLAAAAAAAAPDAAATAAATGSSQWFGAFIDDMQRKMAVASPPALALTLQVLVAHDHRPSAAWTQAFLSAATPFLEAPLPLTQAQAAGAAAAAAAVAAGRGARPGSRPTGTPSAPLRAGVSTPGSATGAAVVASFTPPQLAQLLGGLAALQLQEYVTPAWLALVVRQVEGRAVQSSYRDLAEALHGVVRLGGDVREAVCNQLLIVSQAKLAVASPVLLSHTLAVVAAAEGRKVSPKWWEEVQRVLAAQLKAAAAIAAMAAHTPAGEKPPVTAWYTTELSQVVSALLALRRDKAGADFGPPLAAALAAVVSSSGGGGAAAAVVAALPFDASIAYVEACAEVPQLGVPPPALLQQYLSYSRRLLAACGGDRSGSRTDAAAAVALSEQAQPVGAEQGQGKGKERDRKRARARAEKRSAGAGGALPSTLLQHLPSAIAVGRLLAVLPHDQRPAAAAPWLSALAAAGAAAAPSLPTACAADVLWLLAKLDTAGDAAEVGAAASEASAELLERRAALAQQLTALAARVDGTADAPGGSAGGSVDGPLGQASRRLPSDVVLDTVWALTALGFMPSARLTRELARALPRRLASLPQPEALQLLRALARSGPVGQQAVAEADAAGSASGPTMSSSTSTSSSPAPSSSILAVEVGRYLEAHVLPSLDGNALVDVLEAAATLGLPLPPHVTSAAAARLAAAAEANALRGRPLYDTVVALRELGAAPSPEQLEVLCDAVAAGALDGTLGGVLEIAQAAGALYDMGARPGVEWLDCVFEAILSDLDSGAADAGVQRPPLTARSLVVALAELASRFDANYVVLGVAACRGVMEDLEGQLPLGGLEQQQSQQQQQQQAAEEEMATKAEVESLEAADLAMLPDSLLQPLDLSDVVLLLVGLDNAQQQPPDSLWSRVESAVRPGLRQGKTRPRGAAATPPAGLAVSDASLQELLRQMGVLRYNPSIAFLQDLEHYLGSRMSVQSPHMVATLASHCMQQAHVPGPDFLRVFMQRIEGLLPQLDTRSALPLFRFVTFLIMSEAQDEEGRNLAAAKYGHLLQGLLECTRGEDLAQMSQEEPAYAVSTVTTVITVISSFDLSLPHEKEPERRATWVRATQALTLGRLGELGWVHAAALLHRMELGGCAPEPQWLADFYKGFESEAANLPPLELESVARRVSDGYQPALAPTLPARLAAALEDRMREFAVGYPRVIVGLLNAVGLMGHVVRTEVLQAAEVVLTAPLAAAPRVLEESMAMIAAQAEGADRAQAEQVAAAMSSAAAAEDMMNEVALVELCQALNKHAYRPGPKLVDAIMNTAYCLHVGTIQFRLQLSSKPLDKVQQPRLAWQHLTCLGVVLTSLAEWGVLPTERWRAEAAAAVAVVAGMGDERTLEDPAWDLPLMMAALRVMAEWRQPFSEVQLGALEEALVERMDMCERRNVPYDTQLARQIGDVLRAAREGRWTGSDTRGGGGEELRGKRGAESGGGLPTGTRGATAAASASAAAFSSLRSASGWTGGDRSPVSAAASAGAGSGEVEAAEFRDLLDDALEGLSSPNEEAALLEVAGAGASISAAQTAVAIAEASRVAQRTQLHVMTDEANVSVSSSVSPAASTTSASTSGSWEAPAAGTAPAPTPTPATAPAVDAPSTRIPFRRLTPAERAGASRRTAASPGAPPAPPAGMDSDTADGRRRRDAAIAQLLQLLPTQSRPRQQQSPAAVEEEEEDLASDEDLMAASTAPPAAAAAAARHGFGVGKAGSSNGRARGRGLGSAQLGRHSSAKSSSGTAVGADMSSRRPGSMDPNDPSTWSLLDRELEDAGFGTARGEVAVQVVEPEVIDP